MAIKAEVLEATEDLIRQFAPTLRPEELRELKSAGIEDPLEMMLGAMVHGDLTLIAMVDNLPAAAIGVSPLYPTRHSALYAVGEMWFLTGTQFLKHPREALRLGPPIMERILSVFPCVMNVIDGRYTGALLLAEKFGAEFGWPVAYGPERLPFIPYMIQRR